MSSRLFSSGNKPATRYTRCLSAATTVTTDPGHRRRRRRDAIYPVSGYVVPERFCTMDDRADMCTDPVPTGNKEREIVFPALLMQRTIAPEPCPTFHLLLLPSKPSGCAIYWLFKSDREDLTVFNPFLPGRLVEAYSRNRGWKLLHGGI